jgi:hypothetical protein
VRTFLLRELTSVTIFLKNSVIIYFFNDICIDDMKRAKTKHDDLRGVSAKLPEADLVRLKGIMSSLKSNHGVGYSVADLLLTIMSIPFDTIDSAASSYLATKSINSKVISRLDISDDAKSKIEAILAEEAMKKG